MRKAVVISILLVVVLLAVAIIAEAQQPKKVPLIGFLSSIQALPAAFGSMAITCKPLRAPRPG
jgi:hypothetical protein